MNVDLVSLGLTAIQTGTGTAAFLYQAFHRTKVEALCTKLLESGVDFSSLEKNPTDLGYFFSVIERFRREANMDKIEHWKNALVHLITDFHEYDYKDNLMSILESLTAFDLTVLSQFHLTNKRTQDEYLQELMSSFVDKDVSEDMVIHSIRRLTSQNLITEVIQPGTTYGTLTKPASRLYKMNDLGEQFIRFVADYKSNESL